LPERQKGRWRPGPSALLAGVGVVLLVVTVVVFALGSTGGSRRRPPPSPSPVGPQDHPPPNRPQFGANVNIVFSPFTYPPAQINAQLQALHETGATIARSDAFWEAAEPTAPVDGVHHYDWSFADSVAGSLAAHELRWLPIIDYSAPWAQSVPGQDHSPPSSVSGYASYAAAFAARYGVGGTFWRTHPNLAAEPVDTYEIWNEPDGNTFWVPHPDPKRFAMLYLRARAAILAVQPTARVIIGGLTNPVAFLPAMLAARPDLRAHVDGVGIHLYLPTPTAIVGAVNDDRALLASLGLPSVPLYLTEFGWTRRPKGARFWLPERLRPEYIAATFSALGRVCGLAGVFLYTWVTRERNVLNNQDWFGIHPPRGGSTADSRAFASGLQAASANSRRRTCAGA
jgi:hypothetical protein